MEKQEASLTIYLIAEEENKGGQIFSSGSMAEEENRGGQYENNKNLRGIVNYTCPFLIGVTP
jgi:hypothetical protein